MTSTEDVYSPDLVTSWTIEQEEYFEIGIFDGTRFVVSEIKFATGLCSPAPSAIPTPPTTVSPSPPPTSCSAAPECSSAFPTNLCVSGITGPFSFMNGNYIASTKWLVPWNWTDWFALAITDSDYDWPRQQSYGDPNSGEFACGLELTMLDGDFEHGGIPYDWGCYLPGMALQRGTHTYIDADIPLDDGTYDVKSSHGNYFSYCAKMPLVPNYIHEDDLEQWNSQGPLVQTKGQWRGIFYHVNFMSRDECEDWDSTKEKGYEKYIGTWVLAGPEYSFFDRYSYLQNPHRTYIGGPGYAKGSIEYASFSSGECPAIEPEEPEIYGNYGYDISPYFRQTGGGNLDGSGGSGITEGTAEGDGDGAGDIDGLGNVHSPYSTVIFPMLSAFVNGLNAKPTGVSLSIISSVLSVLNKSNIGELKLWAIPQYSFSVFQ